VGIGVGLAVMAGMLRFLYSWSLKPFAIVLVLLLLSVSVWAVFEPNMRSLTGVAWDCGGITTGPVTVPLVLALGIGICRVVGSAGSGTAGFGVVTLASLFPILTVMMLGIPFLHSVPKPMAEAEFMAARERAEIVRMFETPEQMTGYVLQNASPSSQLIYFGGDTAKMISCLQSLVCDDIKCARVMGADPGMLRKWALEKGTSIQQAAVFGSVSLVPDTDIKKAELDPRTFGKTVISNTKAACQAIIPLCLFLIFMLIFVLRERLNRYDEVLTGIVFALIGLGLFNIGIEFGLANLGKQVGGLLPSTFKAIPVQDEAKRIQGFDTALVQTAIKPDGERERFFYTKEHGVYIPLLFDNDKYDPDKHQYLYVPQRGPIAGREGGPAGIVILLLFALIMGYGATLAEPALNALGLTVEELSVGTFKKRLLMQSVAIGVGIGIAFGLVKIVYDVPIIYLLIPPYIAALVLTIFSTEEFVNIGWDSAGVTTGPVTVPLVLALGLGVGIQMNVVEGFGILAMASVWPILSVLLVGIVIRWRRRMMVKRIIGKQKEEAAV